MTVVAFPAVQPRRESYDADEVLRRMIADADSDWPDRILNSVWAIGFTTHAVSRAEIEVLNAISHGLTTDMVAELLVKEASTVKSQLKSARMKLCAKNTTHAVAMGLRQGLIT